MKRNFANILLSSHFQLIVLLLLTLAVFAPHLNNGFVFDDHGQIEKNAYVHGSAPWTDSFTQGIWAQSEGDSGGSNKYYRPIFPLVYRLVYLGGHGQPWAFHLLSLGLHLLVVVLVLVALRQLDFPPLPAFAAAALFALHPLVGEVVYWAACTSELLVQLGLLIALIATLDASRRKGLRRSFGLVGALGGTVLALLAKETAVLIAPLLTLEILRHPRQERVRRLWAVMPLWLATVGYLWLRARIVSSHLGQLLPDGYKDVGQFGAALAWYFKQFLFPYPLTTVHSFAMHPTIGQLGLGFLFIILLMGLTIWLLRAHPGGAFWLGWMVVPLLLPLVPLLFTYKQATGPVAERYMYLSLVPWCALTVCFANHIIARCLPHEKIRLTGTILVLFACFSGGVMVYFYGSVFRNDTTYFDRAYKYNPKSAFVLEWLGVLELEQNRLQSALSLLDKATVYDPGLVSLAMNRAFVLTKLRRLPEAVQVYQTILQRNPGQPGVHLQLGNILQDLGRSDEAIYHYREELKLNPENTEAMSSIAIYLFQHNDPNAAIAYWEKALSIEKSPYVLFDLGMAYHNLGQRRLADNYLRQFLQVANGSLSRQRNLARQWLNE